MGKGKRDQTEAQTVVENKENEDEEMMDIDDEDAKTSPPVPRPSKFVEATMNSRSSIHPPPGEQWASLGIDHLIEGYNEENSAPPVVGMGRKSVSRTTSGSAVNTVSSEACGSENGGHEGTLGKFSRAVASFFGGAGSFSLGKRKAGNENAERSGQGVERAADAKERAEAAYAEAKALGLLPAPKVFVRPVSKMNRHSAAGSTTPGSAPPTPVSSALLSAPRTPTLYKSPSKKDLQRQKRLSKRVSDLEFKLAEARKELAMTLSPNNSKAPPVPPIPARIASISSNRSSPGPRSSPIKQMWSYGNTTTATTTPDSGKIVKKRKTISPKDDTTVTTISASKNDVETTYKQVTTDSDYSHGDSEHEPTKSMSTAARLRRKASSRLKRSKSAGALEKDEAVIVVPDARVGVPPIPRIPSEMEAFRSKVQNPDGYGGLEHEMF